MRLIWLEHDTPFPDPEQALEEPAGLLAAGADCPSRAYALRTVRGFSLGSQRMSHRFGGLPIHGWCSNATRYIYPTL